MELDFSDPGKVRFYMNSYTDKVLEEYCGYLGKPASTPASDFLFDVRPDESQKLPPEAHARLFHHFVVQLLFLSTRVQRDIKTAVEFLTTRVRAPDDDDWGKLGRVMRYLAGLPYLPLTLEADKGLDVVMCWWVDTSFAVHADFKGHSGLALSFGKGAIIDASKKQRINTRSTTECELVGFDDTMP